MAISLDQQVAKLAAEGHKEIVVIQLPSQRTQRKRRKAKTTPKNYA